MDTINKMDAKSQMDEQPPTFTKRINTIDFKKSMHYNPFAYIRSEKDILKFVTALIEGARSQLEDLQGQQEAAKQELQKPFTLAGELAEKEARLATLNAELNIDGDGGLDVLNDTDSREEQEPTTDAGHRAGYGASRESAKSARPSILDDLRSFDAGKIPAVPNSGKRTVGVEI